MMRRSNHKGLPAVFLLICILMAGCVRQTPVLLPEYTLPTPTPELTPVPTPVPTPTPTPEPTVAPEFDALGSFVGEKMHYQQYISLE